MVFGEAALTADLTTASRSEQRSPPRSPHQKKRIRRDTNNSKIYYQMRVLAPLGLVTLVSFRGRPWPGPGPGPQAGPGPAKKDAFFFLFKRVCKPLLLHEFVRNSSFTRQVDLIIASSRSGTSFSSCLTSSIYFSITNNMFFLGTTPFYVSRAAADYPGDTSVPSPPTHFWTLQYRKVSFLANGESLYPHL